MYSVFMQTYERSYLPSARQYSQSASLTKKVEILFLFVRGCSSYCDCVCQQRQLFSCAV